MRKERMSYGRANELPKRNSSKKGWTQQNLEFIACAWEGLQKLLQWVHQTDFFREMGAGAVRKHGTIL